MRHTEAMASGYVYILANSSMPGLVKVGKTTRSPSERADELSGVTGAASPFIVVYEEHFEDCGAAEAFVHTTLSNRGLKVSENREFFRAAVSDVVKIITSIPKVQLTGGSSASGRKARPNPNRAGIEGLDGYCPPQPWDALMAEAALHRFGLKGHIQDRSEAYRLYRDAARLGSPMAYENLGVMRENGEGVPKDHQRALEFYKDGIKKNNYFCYGGMARIFLAAGHSENTRKALSLMIAAGEADGWKTNLEYTGRHIGLLFTILFVAFLARGGYDDSLFLIAQAYLPEVMSSVQERLERQRLKAAPGDQDIERNFLITLRKFASPQWKTATTVPKYESGDGLSVRRE